jgi:hypothetical protein
MSEPILVRPGELLKSPIADPDEELITRQGIFPGMTMSRGFLEELREPDFLAELLRWEGLEWILSFPELCAALRTRLAERNSMVCEALRDHVLREWPRPKPKRGPHPDKNGKYKKDLVKELLTSDKSNGDVGQEMYEGAPRSVTSRRVSALKSLTKDPREPAGMLGDLQIYRMRKPRESRKSRPVRRAPAQ